MFVRQKIGRQAGMIVEMPFAEAKACVANDTAANVTDQEIQEAGHLAVDANIEVPPEQLLAGYRIEPAEAGGFDLFDAGGVKVSAEPFHNHIAAREGAINYARKARNLPDLAEPVSAGGSAGGGSSAEAGETVGYDKMNAEELRAEAEKRTLLDSSGARSRKDWAKLLERNDVVIAAIAARDFDALLVDELRALAERDQIDLIGKTAKADIVDAVAEHFKAPDE